MRVFCPPLDSASNVYQMSFVADDFVVPVSFDGPGFRMEPLGPEHNERDHDAWMSSIDHIWKTPDFPRRRVALDDESRVEPCRPGATRTGL